MADRSSISVKLIRGARVAIARRPLRFLMMVAMIGVLVWIGRGIYTVDNGETAARMRFGALADDAIGPGMRFRLPGIERVEKVPTGEVIRLELSGDYLPTLALVTGDENLIDASIVVQYRVAGLGNYLFNVEDAESFVSQTVRAALVEAIAKLTVDDVLTTGKAAIQTEVRTTAQSRLDSYGSGVVLTTLSVQKIDPPMEAAAAFRAVSDARAEAAQLVNNADSARGRDLRLARGRAGEILAESRADSDRRSNGARGAVARFDSLLTQKRRSPNQVRTELYNDTVQSVFPRAQLIFLAPGENPRIDLQLLRRADPPPPSFTPTNPDPPRVSPEER